MKRYQDSQTIIDYTLTLALVAIPYLFIYYQIIKP
jgi:hypothetical protein